jgi:hypothetical protein
MNNAHDRQITAEDTFKTFQALLNCAKVKPIYNMEEEDILSIMDRIVDLKNKYKKA